MLLEAGKMKAADDESYCTQRIVLFDNERVIGFRAKSTIFPVFLYKVDWMIACLHN